MQVSINPGTLNEWTGNLLLIGILENELQEHLNLLAHRYGKGIDKKIKANKFKGKSNDLLSFDLLNEEEDKVILIGLGKSENLKIETLRKAIAKASRLFIGSSGRLGIHLPWELVNQGKAVQAVSEATRLCFFKDQRFMSQPEEQITPEQINLIGVNETWEEILETVNPTCAGVELARELVGAPPNELSPEVLAETAKKISEEFGLKLKLLEREECEKLGMGAYLAVAKGSDLPPKFIHLKYQSKGEIKKKLAIVGKGLTFDSGGYNLKVGASQIELMKFDMGGSAAVLGTARAISEIKPAGIEVDFIIAACENMINGSAVHPGDIVKASNGTTIEINNTDAEGRLTLADALVYACNQKPDAIVDLATLTGACVIALGDEIAGLWSNNDLLAKDLIASANTTGEGLWRMPLPASYKEGLKSLLADLKNTGPRAGGSITAALFLKEFVDEDIPWAHIDIAGTVWSDKGKGVDPAGATGYGVRTLINWISAQPLVK